MSVVRPLDLVDALGIVPRLCARHREEISRMHANLTEWARSRVSLPGAQWTLDIDGQVMAIGGVIDEDAAGILWIAGAIGWERHVRTLLRCFKAIKAPGIYQRLRCRCYADNFAAQHFVERLGFARGEVRNGIVHYGMTI